MINSSGLLYIEPSDRVSTTPVLDSLTRRMAAAFRKAQRGTWSGSPDAFALAMRILERIRPSRREPPRPAELFSRGPGWLGWHDCACGVMSSNQDYLLENGQVTNSLCVHYLAWHRDEVPAAELRKVAALPEVDGIVLTSEELANPWEKHK